MSLATKPVERPYDTLSYMKVGFVGGGSGGHFYPLLAVAEVFNEYPDRPELYYFGPTPTTEKILPSRTLTTFLFQQEKFVAISHFKILSTLSS